MKPSLINLMVRLSLKEGGESIIEVVLRFIHIFQSAINPFTIGFLRDFELKSVRVHFAYGSDGRSFFVEYS